MPRCRHVSPLHVLLCRWNAAATTLGPWHVTTAAGSGEQNIADGPLSKAGMHSPTDVAVDSTGAVAFALTGFGRALRCLDVSAGPSARSRSALSLLKHVALGALDAGDVTT